MKKIYLLALMTITLFALSACGGSTTQPTTEHVSSTEAPPQPSATLAAAEAATPTSSSASTDANPATEAPTAAQTTSGVSFANDVMPIFQNYCFRCHGQEDVKEGLDLTTYNSLMAGSFNGSVITPGNASDSYLVEVIANGKMPKRGPKLSDQEIQTITDWVNQGAQNN